MVSRQDEIRKQMNEVWKQTVDQLEMVKRALLHSADRFEADLRRLRVERDRVLKQLGEQTHRMANQGKLPMPTWVKETVDRLNSVIDSVVKKKGPKSKRSGKKTTRSRATRKVTKRAAR